MSRAIAEAESRFAIERAHAGLWHRPGAKERAEDEADAAEKARAAAAGSSRRWHAINAGAESHRTRPQ